jgi:hypothetical protein
MLSKKCSVCREEKPLELFSKQKAGLYGVRSYCKQCQKVDSKKRYEEQKKVRLHQIRIWQQNNPDKVRRIQQKCRDKQESKLRQKEWYENNKSRLMVKQKAREKLYFQTSISYRIARRLRARLRCALKGTNKPASAVADVGISISVLIMYLNLDCLDKYGIIYTGNEKLFHIDHIKPLSSFDLTDHDQIKKAIHWSNLQILTVEDNCRKGKKSLT